MWRVQLIYFSPVPWDSYEQRPHYFVRYFLDAGDAQVLWVNPHTARLPSFNDRHRLHGPGRVRPLWLDRPAGLTVMNVRALPVDPLPGGARLNRELFWREAFATLAAHAGPDTVIGIGRPTSLALAALQTCAHRWSFYDAMDMFPEFYRGLSRRHTSRVESLIARRVTRIFASAHALADKFRTGDRPVTLVNNAYDMSLLPAVGDASARRGLGFLGCMGRWFDWPLTVRIAQAIDPLPVTLVGPRPTPGPSRLPRNVQWLPECHQADTIAHLSTFAAGLIPFTHDPLTAGVDPIKYYQYRGAGLPVLSTSFGEMTIRTEADDTFFVDRAEPLEQVLQRALSYRPDPARIPAFRAVNTWQARLAEARVLNPS